MSTMKLFKSLRSNTPEDYYHFEAVEGERLTIAGLLVLRAYEDALIERGSITETDRHDAPKYLQEEWIALVGIDEVRRERIPFREIGDDGKRRTDLPQEQE